MQKVRRKIRMEEIKEKQDRLSELFHATVHIKISSINKGNIEFFSDSAYSDIVKRFLT